MFDICDFLVYNRITLSCAIALELFWFGFKARHSENKKVRFL